MITAKQLKDTYPHRQMRMYIEDEYRHMTPQGKAAQLGALVKKFLKNFEADVGWGPRDLDEVPQDIDQAFTWEDTPEGFEFWRHIHRDIFVPVEIVEAPKPAKGKAPKKRVGWWV